MWVAWKKERVRGQRRGGGLGAQGILEDEPRSLGWDRWSCLAQSPARATHQPGALDTTRPGTHSQSDEPRTEFALLAPDDLEESGMGRRMAARLGRHADSRQSSVYASRGLCCLLERRLLGSRSKMKWKKAVKSASGR